MAKNKRKQSLKKDTKAVAKAVADTTPDPNLIKVDLANAPLVTVRLLAAINQNLANLFTYLKHRDIENGRPK